MRKACVRGMILIATLISFRAEANHLLGYGADSCATWGVERHKPNSILALGFDAWSLGFLSGVGAQGINDPLNGVDANAVFAWLDIYCRSRPLENLAQADIVFVAAHRR